MEMKSRTGTQKELETLLPNIVAYLDSIQARLASLRELQSALSALLPSVLLPQGGAFKPLQDASQGELRC